MKTNKNLAVVILNYNDPGNTIRYTKEIQKYDCIDKIVIIDNNSPDGSYDKLLKLASEKVDVIKSDKNGGYAYGNNYAIRYLNDKYGEFKYITISNPDVEVSEDAYKKCLNFLDKHKDVAIAAPRMYDINDNPHQLSGWKLRSLKGDIMDSSPALTAIIQKPHIERYDEAYLNQDVAYVDCVAGSFFMIKHEIFKKVGYFDENTFLYFEEDILGNKIKELGYKNVVLNTCKFNHYESVTVDKTMNYMRKFKNLQKSKKYYHKTYNPQCNKFSTRWKLFFLDWVTFFRPLEDKLRLEDFINGWKRTTWLEKLIVLIQAFILLIQIILWPIYKLARLCRRRKKVLYFSLVTWKWIKQRPHFVALELVNSGNFKVDYRYQTLYDKFMPDQKNVFVENEVQLPRGFKIKPYKIIPETTKNKQLRNRLVSLFRTSFWNYDKIIITQPNQMDFFSMKIQKLKGVEFYYEAMDNYEFWEGNKEAYLDKQKRLVSMSKHIFVSAEKLKNKLTDMYNLPDNFCSVIRNGYDKSTFEKYDKVEDKFKHPCVTYIGTIDDWFDFDSIESYAKNNPKVYFNIIGPMNPSVKEKAESIKCKNVKFHGPIEHHTVPGYIENSEVLMLPFLINELIEFVDPVKLYEYLYLKKPVISSYWEELNQFEGLVYFYKDRKDFAKTLDNALKTKFKETKEYKKLMNDSTWHNRLKKYIKELDK